MWVKGESVMVSLVDVYEKPNAVNIAPYVKINDVQSTP